MKNTYTLTVPFTIIEVAHFDSTLSLLKLLNLTQNPIECKMYYMAKSRKLTTKDITDLQETEYKDYLADEIRRRTLAATLNLTTGEGLDTLTSEFSYKYTLPIETAQHFLQTVLKDHARCMPVTEILTNQIIETSAMVKQLKEDIGTYDTDYHSVKDATEQGIYGGLKQKAYKNLTDVMKCQIDLLTKMGGLQLARERLKLEHEKFQTLKDNKFEPDITDKVNYGDMTEEEVDKRLKDKLNTKKHVYQSDQLIDPAKLIDFSKE